MKIKLKNIDDAIIFSKNMQEKFPELYFVNWTETHKNFFRAIQIEKKSDDDNFIYDCFSSNFQHNFHISNDCK